MRRKAFWSRMMLGAVACAAAAVVAAPAVAAPGDVTLMSRQSGSGPAGDRASVEPFATRDGRNVAFLSAATNLGPSAIATTVNQAWVRSLDEGANQLASRADDFGAPADAVVSNVSVSDDGNLVAFQTRATNLGPTAPNTDRVFVHDLTTGDNTLIAENAVRPSISGDGQWVAFHSSANNVTVASVAHPATTEVVSSAAGADYPRLSADGRYVAFNQSSQVVMRDRTTHTLETVSRATGASGAVANTAPVGAYPAISRDGRHVVWSTAATNLDPDDTNNKIDVYERDRQTDTTTLVSRADGAGGAVGDNHSQTPTVSDDGRLVGFLSRSTNFSALDDSTGDNAWIRDTLAGTLTWVHGTASQTGAGAPHGTMQGVSLAGDGDAVFYDTNATILPGQEDASAVADVFRRELADPPLPALSVADAPAVTEGGPGATTNATFTVTLSYAPRGPVAVHYATADGTATAGDYTPTTGTLTLPAGQTTATITVPVIGDDAVEPDETFTLSLDGPDGADLGRATATATIVNDDQNPPPPPAEQPKTPVQAEHALLGAVLYRPSFAPGADTGIPKNILTSPFAKTPLRVRLLDAGGHVVRQADVARPDPRVLDYGLVDFEMDSLPACSRCTVSLGDSTGDAVADAFPIDFGGEPGQTVVQLEAGRQAAGGRVQGTIESPLAVSPTGLVVRVVRPGARVTVLADSTKATLQCGHGVGIVKGTGLPSTTCPVGSVFTYRLSGLPQDGSAATVQLLQKTPTGDPIVVDTQDVVLAGGDTFVPTLEALDAVPRRAVGRVLYGKIATLAPFAPGAVTSGELVPDPKERPEVALVRDGKAIKKATVSASTGVPTKTGIVAPAGITYSLDGLDACTAKCALELRIGKTTRSFPVVVPERSPSITRADLRYPATGTSEFLEGTVTTFGRADVRVKVTDAKGGKVLADSATVPDPTCRTGARCTPKQTVPVTGTAAYRLGGLPAERAVEVTLSVSGKDVDTEAVTTAPEGQVTAVDTLVAPLAGARGRTVVGTVTSGRGFVAGVGAPRVDPKTIKGVRLVDAAGNVLANATLVVPAGLGSSGAKPTPAAAASTLAYQLTGLPACADCAVELVERSGAVGDRAAVTIPDEALSVVAGPALLDGELTAGKWVNVSLAPSAKVSPRDLRVTIAVAGKVVADSGATKPCANGTACTATGGLGYRFGGVPADVDTATVTVTLRGKKAASDTVRFAPGSAETSSSLVVRVPSAGPTKGA
jgi:Tol biopolymer transport system component